ncbi:MAG: hypothetical protein KDA93_17295 [Planctomycetaceae bacterium]|nr:hypothetical protein [Planctomycetaceae bacterium]
MPRSLIAMLVVRLLSFSHGLSCLADEPKLRSSEELAALNAIIIRHEKLRSLIVSYERIDLQNAGMTPEQNKREEVRVGQKLRIVTGSELKECRFQFLDGQRRFDWVMKYSTFELPKVRQIFFIHQDRLDRYSEEPAGVGRGDRDLNIAHIRANVFSIDLALGLRFSEEHELIAPEDMRGFDVEIINDNLVVLQTARHPGENREEIVHQWTYDERLGHALVKYETSLSDGSRHELTMENLFDWGDIYLPGFVSERAIIGDTRLNTSPSYFRITNYRVNDPQNTEESFAIDWPDNTTFVRQPENLGF